MTNIPANLTCVRKNITRAAEKCGRNPQDITLVCVTKQISVDLIQEAINAGLSCIGESRVEEASAKWGKLPAEVEWHMIGHLQTRKVKDAVKMFNLIHSVDSVRLAVEIDKRSKAIDKVQDILIEVNVSGEESKYGFKPEETLSSIKKISEFTNIRVLGLMTMAPFVDDPELTRPVFRGLRELSEKVVLQKIPGVQMKYLSMGMTQDYIVAIEEGANMLRIGTAIFKGA